MPLLIRGNGPVPCGVANPVGVELLDAAGQPLTTRVETTDLPAGRTAVDSFTAEKAAMVWLQWRAAPSTPHGRPGHRLRRRAEPAAHPERRGATDPDHDRGPRLRRRHRLREPGRGQRRLAGQSAAGIPG